LKTQKRTTRLSLFTFVTLAILGIGLLVSPTISLAVASETDAGSTSSPELAAIQYVSVPATPTLTPEEPFSMVIMNDPQFFWLTHYDNGKTAPDNLYRKAVCEEQFHKMNAIYHIWNKNSEYGQWVRYWPDSPNAYFEPSFRGKPVPPLKGVIINGDLTDYNSAGHGISATHWYEPTATRWRAESYTWFYRDYYVTFLNKKCPGLPVYAGFGNHDSGWTMYDLACALVLDYDTNDQSKRRLWVNFPNTGIRFHFNENTKKGSLAYSWNIGNYHFVQANNLHQMGQLGLGGKWLDGMEVESPVDWVVGDVLNAARDKKKIVICCHGQYFADIEEKDIWKNVVAVFRGHYDSRWGTGLNGWVTNNDGEYRINGFNHTIPIFQAGHSGRDVSANFYTDHQMIIAEFADDYINVGLVDCGDWAGGGGIPHWILGWPGAPTKTTLITLSVGTKTIPEFRMEVFPALFLVETLLIIVLISRKIRSVKIDR